MDDMISYIFRNLNSNKDSITFIAKNLRKQKHFNNSVKFFVVAMTANLIIQNFVISELCSTIHDLKDEIKELKNTEGD